MKFYFRILLLLVIFLGINSSCGSDQKETIVITETTSQNSLYGHNTIKTPQINVSAQKFTNLWGAFNDLEEDLERLHKSNLEGLTVVTDRLVQHSDSISKKVPDTLNTPAVTARMLVLDTQVNLLHQEIRKGRLDSLQIEERIKETKKANSNFIIQINEKFAKDIIDDERRADEEKEIKKQKKYLDSIFKAELRDNDN